MKLMLDDENENSFLFDAIVRACASESVTEAVAYIGYKTMANANHRDAIEKRRRMLASKLK